MKIVFGPAGTAGSAAVKQIAARRPEWSVWEATDTQWRDSLRHADVAVPISAPLAATDLEGSTIRFVQQLGTGVDTIDVEACAQRGIKVAHIPSDATANAASVAELVTFFALALVRRLDEQRDAAQSGTPGTVAHTLMGRRFVLLGMGGVGREVATRLAGLGVELLGVRAHPEHGMIPGVRSVHGPEELDHLLAQADGIIGCIPGGGEAVLNADRFTAMRTGSYVINVARGSVIDEHALLQAIDSGQIAGAALDVLTPGTLPTDNALLHHPKVIVTPHIAGVTVESGTQSVNALIDNISRFERQEPLRWELSALSEGLRDRT